MKYLKNRRSAVIALVCALAISGVAVAASVVVLKQTTSSVPVPPGLKAVCSNPLSSSPNYTWNYVVFACGAAPQLNPAFAVIANGTYTPTFNLSGTNYVDLFLLPYSSLPGNATSCGGFSGAVVMTNGTSFGFPPGALYVYCADYPTTNTTLGALSVTWSQ